MPTLSYSTSSIPTSNRGWTAPHMHLHLLARTLNDVTSKLLPPPGLAACCVLMLILVYPGSLSAQESQSLTLENIFTQSRGLSDARISPDGSRVAFVGSNADESGIFVQPTSTSQSPFFLVQGRSPRWHPDNNQIVFVRDGQIWTVTVGDEPETLVNAEIQQARDPVFSPDGITIAFYTTVSGSQDIWVVPADGSGQPRQVTDQLMSEDDGRFAPSWSPDGQYLAAVSNRADYWSDDVWRIDVTSGDMYQVSQGLMASSTPVWSPSGDRIALLGTSKDGYWYQDLSDIYVLDLAAGTEKAIDMQVYASDYIMRNQPVWSENGDHLFFVYHERGSFYLWSVPREGGVATRVTHKEGMITNLSASGDAMHFAYTRSTLKSGPELQYLNLEQGTEQQLTDFAPAWEGLSTPVEVSYRTFDGLFIQGFLYHPPGFDDGKEYPTLVQVHGGGTNSYYRRLNLIEHYLASQGYVVLAINYRGGSGFGREFQDLAVEDWLNRQSLDAVSAADYLRSLPYTNGSVGIYGGSYGGSMSMAAISRDAQAFDAAVAMRGAYSKTETLDETDRLGKIFSITGHGGTPDERPDTYEKSNTIDRIENIETPVLLMHGEEDRRVPFRHFELAVERLEEFGKDYESHSYPGEGHGFSNPENSIDMYSRLEAYFRKHLSRDTE